MNTDYKNHLQLYVESITNRKGSNYVCPLCKSGTKKNGTPAFSIAPNGVRWTCFSCNEKGDIYDLIGHIEGISDYAGQQRKAAELFGNDSNPKRSTVKKEQVAQVQEADRIDFTLFIQATQQAVTDPRAANYLQGRAITPDIIRRFGVGFYDDSPEHRHIIGSLTKGKGIAYQLQGRPAIILPYPDTGYFIARSIDDQEPKYLKPERAISGPEPIFNLQSMHEPGNSPVFAVEGVFDAFSVMIAGGKAAALAGNGGQRLLADLKKNPTSHPLILALDNDEAGRHAADKLEEQLQTAGVSCSRTALGEGKYKDANDYLQSDFRGLQEDVAAAIRIADPADRYRDTSNANYLQGFMDGIIESIDTPATPTGFTGLDGLLDGGMYEGLYILGAVSSMGKTALALQIADNVAKAGGNVLIFSLEMSRTELMARSISRLTFELCRGYSRDAKTARGILDGHRYKDYSEQEKALIQEAMMAYGQYAENLYITEGVGDIGVRQVRETIAQHIQVTGCRPFVLIDYLQQLAPHNERATDKQNTDKAVLELKRISREYKLPVMAISSFNRSSYNVPASMEAFKESGAIEYSADVLLGIQPQDTAHGKEDKNKAAMLEYKKASTRQGEIVILKNRNGISHRSATVTYNAPFNHFREIGATFDPSVF